MIEVGKAHRTDHLIHPLFPSPCRSGLKKRVDNLGIVDKIDKAESHSLATGTFVHLGIDYRSNTPDRLSVAKSHKRLCLTVIKSWIFVRAQRIHIVQNKRRDKTVVALIQVYAKLYKLYKFFFEGAISLISTISAIQSISN